MTEALKRYRGTILFSQRRVITFSVDLSAISRGVSGTKTHRESLAESPAALEHDSRVSVSFAERVSMSRGRPLSVCRLSKQNQSGVVTLHNNDTRKQRESGTASFPRVHARASERASERRSARPLNILSTRSDYLHYTRRATMITIMAIRADPRRRGG